jgi:RNA polymerase sigma factor (sigma-70 family)
VAATLPTTTETSDNDLMCAIAARDGDAFSHVTQTQAPAMYRIAYRMLGDATEAEDIAQEALLRLWDNAAKWRGDGPGIGAWLNRVTTNLCLDRLRRKRFSSDEVLPDRIDDTPGADEQIDEDRLRNATVAAIGTLSERQRAAIILTYYENCSNQSAADVLDMNIKAFESLLLRARQTLRRTLEARQLLPGFVGGEQT